jgi:hypothetical protein
MATAAGSNSHWTIRTLEMIQTQGVEGAQVRATITCRVDIGTDAEAGEVAISIQYQTDRHAPSEEGLHAAVIYRARELARRSLFLP